MAKLTIEEEIADQEFERIHGVIGQKRPTEYPDPTDDSDEALDQRFQASIDDPRT